jgi:hypothetical protein
LGHLADEAERIGQWRLRRDCELRHTGADEGRQPDLAFEQDLLQSDLLLLAGEKRNFDSRVDGRRKRNDMCKSSRLCKKKKCEMRMSGVALELYKSEGAAKPRELANRAASNVRFGRHVDAASSRTFGKALGTAMTGTGFSCLRKRGVGLLRGLLLLGRFWGLRSLGKGHRGRRFTMGHGAVIKDKEINAHGRMPY